MEAIQKPYRLGSIAFDVIRQNFHRPFIDGKCNRENIEENLFTGVYLGQLGPMNEKDVEFICDIIDMMIEDARQT